MIVSAIAEAHGAGARRRTACREAGLSERTVERWRKQPGGDDRRYGPRLRPRNALTDAEREQAVALMLEPKYASLSPKQLVPRLADEGRYVASESTLYRLRPRIARATLRRNGGTRASAVHRSGGPNQVWSWDITYLPTPVRGRFFYLYLVMDVWSRRIVGWDVHVNESAENAANLIQRICDESAIDPKGLVLHSDNGHPMRGSTMMSTLQWLGVVPSFSRPHVSNDNPYSEALFRTLKYTPAYPRLPFVSLEAARCWMERFVAWYNAEHHHSGIRYVTPDERHYGREKEVLERRHDLYERARRRHPERWSGPTRNWSPRGAVVLNPEITPAIAA
jgi:putative transposase